MITDVTEGLVRRLGRKALIILPLATLAVLAAVMVAG